MATDSQTKPSFSPWRKWGIFCNLVLLVVLVLTVVVMVNYLGRECFLRFHVSTRADIELSPSTKSLLRSLTNRVAVTVYYDKQDALYGAVRDLLNEYNLVSPRISVQTIDYTRDAGAAQKLKAKYKLAAPADKNLVIFDCQDRVKVVPGDELAKYVLEEMRNEKKERVLQRKVTGFLGEKAFNLALLDVTNPKPLITYFLTGHGEHSLESGDSQVGYLEFAGVLAQNDIRVAPLSLLGNNVVPADCNLLVIGGPTTSIPEAELAKIEAYLAGGGRLLALFNANSLDDRTGLDRAIGLEKLLAKWGVRVGDVIIRDPDHSATGSDVVVSAFTTHPIVNPLLGAQTGLDLIRPRPVGKLDSRSAQAADAPRVEAVAFSSPQAFIEGDPNKEHHQFPFMVAVEKGAIQGVIAERGTTRLVVVGDSLFLSNQEIGKLGNRDFAGYAVGWLLERTQFLRSPGPRPLNSFKIVMTKAQLRSVRWVLLGGLPGGVLVLGGLVWLKRRR
jgi:gliding motility-associatede transport system auxiliary component